MARLMIGVATAVSVGTPSLLGGQITPEAVARERTEFANWLNTATVSPYRALVQHPVGPAIRVGPSEAEIPLPGVDARIEQRGAALSLILAGNTRPLPRDRAIPLGKYHLLVGGLPGQAVVTIYHPDRSTTPPPTYYRYDGRWRMEVPLSASPTSRTERMLAPDGVEVEATEAGTVVVTLEGKVATLRVFRIPTAGGEESELEIFFRDGTNGSGTYPAGRFVNLIPTTAGRYLLDFNRARNPFCAYNTVFPCPAPWRGNILPLPVPAGEQYPAAPPAKKEE